MKQWKNEKIKIKRMIITYNVLGKKGGSMAMATNPNNSNATQAKKMNLLHIHKMNIKIK
jgi:hypothetical protein